MAILRTIIWLASLTIASMQISAEPTPDFNLSTIPSTTSATPSGQLHFILRGTGIDNDTLVHVYQKTDQGQIEVATREIKLDEAGFFRIPIFLPLSSATKTFSYYLTFKKSEVIQVPSSGPSPSPSPSPSSAPVSSPAPSTTTESRTVIRTVISPTISFYFDPQFLVQPPASLTIGNAPDGTIRRLTVAKQSIAGFDLALAIDPSKRIQLKWSPVDGATKYLVYRRVLREREGLYLKSIIEPLVEDCKNLEKCYLDTPYELVTETTLSSFIDIPLCSVSTCKSSANYFVVAEKSGHQSERSTSVVVNDSSPPASKLRAALIAKTASSEENRKAELNYCIKHRPYHFFGADIDLELGAYISVAQKTSTTCDSQVYSNTSRFDIDSLATKSQPDIWPYPCVSLATIQNLQPQTTYCIRTCLSDRSGNREDGVDPTFVGPTIPFNNCQSTELTTAKRANAPIQISQLKPTSSGTGLEVGFKVLDADFLATQGVKHFLIEWTDAMDNFGSPFFNDAQRVSVINKDEREFTIEKLETAHKYCARIKALNSTESIIEATDPVCSETLDNRLRVIPLSIGSASTNESYKLAVKFYVVNPNPLSANEKVEFVKLQVKPAGSADWITVSENDLTLPKQRTLHWDKTQSNQSLNEIVFDSLAYFSGNQQVEFKISVQKQVGYTVQSQADTSEPSTLGAESQTNFGPYPVFSDKSAQSNYTNSALSGCSLNTTRTEFSLIGILSVIMALGILLGFYRRSVGPEKSHCKYH